MEFRNSFLIIVFYTMGFTKDSVEGGDDGKCNKCGMLKDGKEPEAVKLSASSRIVKGKPLNPPNKYPFLVSILKTNSSIFCGGALISPTYILTAGHCFLKDDALQSAKCRVDQIPSHCYMSTNEVQVGTVHPENTFKPKEALGVRRIIPHPTYSLRRHTGDIALVELSQPAPCSATLSPICLPQEDLNKMDDFLSVAGWGRGENKQQKISKKELKEAKVKQVDLEKCQKADEIPNRKLINVICTQNKGSDGYSCRGDSGSPIFAVFNRRFYILGVTSQQTSIGCKNNGYVIYTKAYDFLSWINNTVPDLTDRPRTEATTKPPAQRTKTK